MAVFAFDTLEFVEILKEAGVLEKQAKAITTVIQKSHEVAAPMLEANCREYTSVLKSDFQKLEHSMDVKHELLRHEMAEFKASSSHDMSDLRKDMSDLRKDMQHSIKELESRMTIKLGSIVVAGLGLIVLLAKFLAVA